MTEVVNVALEVVGDDVVLVVNDGKGTKKIFKRGEELAGSFGFAGDAKLEQELLSVIALLCDASVARAEARRAHLEDAAHDEWVTAERLASRMAQHRSVRAIREFIARRIQSYPQSREPGVDPECAMSLSDLPKDRIIQYHPRRAVSKKKDEPMPKGTEVLEPGIWFGRGKGPYRIGAPAEQVRFNRRALLMATLGTVACAVDAELPGAKVDNVIEVLGPKLIEQGDPLVALFLYEGWYQLSPTRRGVKDEKKDRLQRVELLIGAADAAIEVGMTQRGLAHIKRAENLLGRESPDDASLRLARTGSLLQGQAGNVDAALATIAVHADDFSRSQQYYPWLLGTYAQALARKGDEPHRRKADRLFDRVRGVVEGGRPCWKPGELLAVVGSRRAESASRAWEAERGDRHPSSDWRKSVAEGLSLAEKNYEALPTIWKALAHRLDAGTLTRLEEFDEAHRRAKHGIVLATEAGMAHELKQLKRCISRIESR